MEKSYQSLYILELNDSFTFSLYTPSSQLFTFFFFFPQHMQCFGSNDFSIFLLVNLSSPPSVNFCFVRCIHILATHSRSSWLYPLHCRIIYQPLFTRFLHDPRHTSLISLLLTPSLHRRGIHISVTIRTWILLVPSSLFSKR